MEFILGCNYWASNAGAEMWRNYDLNAIKEDIKGLASYGVKHIRVFPNWRDFQPVMPLSSCMGFFYKYCLEGERENTNKYYLDEVMLERFSEFLDVCKENNIKVIVGLVTGWMSGRLFVPPLMYGKNIITDTEAVYFQQLFIKGFVSYFKDREEIYAWDLGNECNCLEMVNDRLAAVQWTATIANAISAADPTRMVISGMHSLTIDGAWTIEDQALHTDMLTTHPYPFCGQHTRIDEIMSYRTTLYPTAQTKFYSEIGNVPCMAEEIGTFSPIICSDENSAAFLRINLLSLWANGASGLMWWCANDQDRLTTFPYSIEMLERELGMFTSDKKAKPVLDEMKSFSEFIDNLPFELPPAKSDAVCLVSRNQEQWGIGYMTYILARRSGLNLEFAYADNEIPESKLYIMPSVNSINILNKTRYEELLKRVYDGADLYLSTDNAYISGFEEFSGLKVMDSYENQESGVTEINGKKIEFSRVRNISTQPTTAEVISFDDNGRPAITVNKYGKGRVFYVNFPPEKQMLDVHNATKLGFESIYKELFKEHIDNYPVKVLNPEVVLTYHPTEKGGYAVILNHSGNDVNLEIILSDGYSPGEVYYGNPDYLRAWDGCVVKIEAL